MSGGHFGYAQRNIASIVEGIEEELSNQGKKIPPEKDFGNDWGEYIVYSKQIQDIFKEAIKYLKLAEVYAQRIDWYLSGDDGEESFLERLKEELENLKKESK